MSNAELEQIQKAVAAYHERARIVGYTKQDAQRLLDVELLKAKASPTYTPLAAIERAKSSLVVGDIERS